MKLLRLSAAVLALAVLTGVAYVNQATETAGTKMTSAADKFLGTLKDEQKKKATFDFDDKERVNWNFIPLQDKERKYTRKGLPMEEMTKDQRAAALELLRAGTSEDGYTKATTIMGLENILRDLEMDKGAMVRNPNWYFVTVFGTPSKTSKWGWRIEGHHLSLNFTIDKGEVVSSTPAFFGANPAIIMTGDEKGKRALAAATQLAGDLYNALDDDQKKAAHQEKHFGEPKQGKPSAEVGEPVGLVAAKMTPRQKEILQKLIESYAQRMPTEIAAAELKQVKEAGPDKVHFAYTGEPGDGKLHSYRVQGPTFVIEYLNIQEDSAKNPANHIHSCWRTLPGDFGMAAK